MRVMVGFFGVLGSLGISWRFSHERGVAVGVVAGLFYGVLMLSWVVSPRGVARWSSRHVLADTALIVPITFFGLLLVRPLPLWGAALAALGLGAVMVPLTAFRRRLLMRNDGRQRRQQGQQEGIKTVPEEVVLRLDRVTATHLVARLYDVGEHLAAGRPIAPMSTEESERLGRVLGDLRRALGPLPAVPHGSTAAEDAKPGHERPEQPG